MNNRTTMPNPFETLAAKKTESYEDYDLSPPKLPDKMRRTFEEAVTAIRNDFHELRIEWVKGTVLWRKKRKDGTEVDLPPASRRILLFLYSRNFKKNKDKDYRKAVVKDMMKPGRVRRAILQVIASKGDNSLSLNEDYQDHYIRMCLTIHRYFRQSGARGFVPDMSRVTYYLRLQRSGSCFLQAPCVALSYLLQACGKSVPPADASRLICHHFNDEQLTKYVVGDHGGDSLAVFRILEEEFFECPKKYRHPTPFFCARLRSKNIYKSVLEMMQDGPGLVSKFIVPDNFYCSPPSKDMKVDCPDLTSCESWEKAPANLIPPGVARFSTWDEPAEFVPLRAPDTEGLKETETSLKTKWKESLSQPEKDSDLLTAITTSTSADLSTPSERSTADKASMLTDDEFDGEDWSHFFDDDEDESSSPIYKDHEPGEGADGTSLHAMVLVDKASILTADDSHDEDWSHFFDDDEDESSSPTYKDHEPGKGADGTPLHAMVLLGHRDVDGKGYWLLQNSWKGPCQIIEVTTEYLIESGAIIYFYDSDVRRPKPEQEWNIRSSSFYCPSPVAESSRFERNDSEDWSDRMVHSMPHQEEDLGLDDIIDNWYKESPDDE